MKKIAYLILLISVLLFLQNCKKSNTDTTTSTTTTTSLYAYLNEVFWVPDTTTATITYTATAKTKVLSCQSSRTTDRINFTLTEPNASADSTFSTGTFILDTTTNAVNQIAFVYSTGDSVTQIFKPATTPTNGTLVITSVDLVHKMITGSFNFDSHQYTYTGGLITNIFIANFTGGYFDMPYKFVKK